MLFIPNSLSPDCPLYPMSCLWNKRIKSRPKNHGIENVSMMTTFQSMCLCIWLCSMCMCSDEPRAGLTNEFTLPMWHCCDNQIPRQACSFPLACLCVWGGSTVPALWQGRYLQYTVYERERESWLNNSRNTSVKLPVVPKSLKWDWTHMLTWTHTQCASSSLRMSRFNDIIWSPAWVLWASTGHLKALRGSLQSQNSLVLRSVQGHRVQNMNHSFLCGWYPSCAWKNVNVISGFNV